LTADEERIEKQVESLRQQKQLLERVQEGLILKSPIAGDVMTWQLHELLDQRPVRRGQVLMTIADLDGPWILELDVADDDLGFINRATLPDASTAEVSFALATNPGETFRGRVSRISRRIEPDQNHRLSATVTVAIDDPQPAQPRPGAGVTARIHCGKYPLGYVWLHQLIETVRTWVVF
jgi:multidrug efflux pump subunit AcrA (membrane-fusion protein)